MSKISPAPNGKSVTLPQKSAWAKGPPSSNTPATISQQTTSQPSAPPAPATPSAPNGYQAHSRRSSAAIPAQAQTASPSALKGGLAVSKGAGPPVPAQASKGLPNVQFGSIDDSNPTLSTSPAAPSPLSDPKQVKSFGSIAANTKPATASASPTISKSAISQPSNSNASSSTASTISGQTGKKSKVDVLKLFQSPSTFVAEPSSSRPTPSTPAANPTALSAQEPSPARPPAVQQNSFNDSSTIRNSPSVRNAPLPQSTPSQNGSQPQQGPGSFIAPHMRQPNGMGSPRSPSFNRGGANGSVRGAPGGQSGAMGSPRMGPPPTPQQNVPSQPPVPGMQHAPGVPPHVQGQISGLPGQMPHPMGMQPMMGWGHYYPYTYYYDTQGIPQYWVPPPGQPGVHTHMQPPPPAQATPQQSPMPLHPNAVPPTPNQNSTPIPISPRPPPPANLNAQVPPTPTTPGVPTPTTGSRLQSGAAPFQPSARRTTSVSIRKPNGEALDIKSLAVKKEEEGKSSPNQPASGETPARRPVSIRMETEDDRKKRLAEDAAKKSEELAKLKAKRDADAAERQRRDQEEKDRRKRDDEDRERKKEGEERSKREVEEQKKRADEDKLEKERADKQRVEQEKLDKERLEKERLEKERLEKERLENERLDKERLEKERLEKERLDKERLDKERLDKERLDKERLEKERLEKERLEKDRLEKDRLEKDRLEKERLDKEEEERKEKERKEAEEKERLRKDQEEKEKERIRLEDEAKRKVEEEEKAKQEAAKRAEEETAAATTPADATPALSSTTSSTPASGPANLPKQPGSIVEPKRRPIPGRLDLSSTSNPNLPQPLPSALASARIIEDIEKVSYPDGIKAPKTELNLNAQGGKFRYDRDFLMQFMNVCKDKPDDLPPLDAIGIEPTDQLAFTRGGGSRRPPPGGPLTPGSRGSIGAIPGPGGSPFPTKNFPGIGNFQHSRPSNSSDERFALSNPRGVGSPTVNFPRPLVGRTPSTSGQAPPAPGPKDTLRRPNSGRGTKRIDSNKLGPAPSHLGIAPVIDATPVEPLVVSENRWVGARQTRGADESSPEFIDRKVKSLLNKLTMEKFDSISAQILEWANRSVNETDGRTLIQVIRLVFEKATDEATWSEMYARLCRYLMERISPDVRDEGIRNAQDGKPIAGGHLFRKYLLNRCQEDFERGWSAKDAAVAAAAGKAENDKAAAAAAEKEGTGDEVLYSVEYYSAQKAKRRGLGLVKFIGELFKLQMLTERIMHECIKKLLSNVDNPEEEEIESLCKLLSTVGQTLDTPKARNHMDIYFARMKELANGGQINSRMQFMLLDVIELRGREWISRNQTAAPTTIAEVHEKAARDRAVAEREALLRQSSNRDSIGRGGRREQNRSEYGPPQVGADGWTTPVTRPPAKAGDLSNFGKIQKSSGLQFGPSSVFSKREKRESASVTRVSSSSNMFAMLNSSEATPDAASIGSRGSTRPPSRKASVDLGSGVASPIEAPQRRKLVLQPRTVREGSVKDDIASTAATSEYGEEETTSNIGTHAAPAMNLDQAKKKIAEDMKELFTVRDLNEAEGYFELLPAEYRTHLVEELFRKAIDAKEADIKLVIDLFTRAANKDLVSESQFEKGFEADIEFLEDMSVDIPMVYTNVARLFRAAKLSGATVERLSEKIAFEGEVAIKPKDKLLKTYADAA